MTNIYEGNNDDDVFGYDGHYDDGNAGESGNVGFLQ